MLIGGERQSKNTTGGGGGGEKEVERDAVLIRSKGEVEHQVMMKERARRQDTSKVDGAIKWKERT